MLNRLHKMDGSLAVLTAGFLAVLIAYAGPAVIFIQAARLAQVSESMLSSWIWAISIGAGVTGIFLSWYLKAPIVTAWSAPGTALLVSVFPELSINEAVAAYITAAGIMFVLGVSGWLDRLVRLIPRGIAAGMLAGILFQFGVGAFRSVPDLPELALGMMAAYIVFRRWCPRYNMVLVLLVGLALAVWLGHTHLSGMQWRLASPELIAPHWSWRGVLSLTLPLVLVTLTGLVLPGMAILRAADYDVPARPILVTTSLASVPVALFGGMIITLAAITAALCTGPQAHEDPKKRWLAGVANGGFYLLGALFAGSIAMLFAALPPVFVAVLAGLALMAAIMGNIADAVQDGAHREAAIITFMATASNLTFLGLGSAFWGVVMGALAHAVFSRPARS